MTSKQYWLSVGPGSVGPRKPETEQLFQDVLIKIKNEQNIAVLSLPLRSGNTNTNSSRNTFLNRKKQNTTHLSLLLGSSPLGSFELQIFS